MKLEPGRYRAKWFSAFTGEVVPLRDTAESASWTSPKAPFSLDSALLLERE